MMHLIMSTLVFIIATALKQYATIGKQRTLSFDIWPVPTIGRVIGYSCVWTMVVAREYAVLSTRFDSCASFLKLHVTSRLNASYVAI